MQMEKSIALLFEQLTESVANVTNEQYCMPLAVLSHATIGQHLRHIIEFFQELDHGYEMGLINYDSRKRNHRIENESQFAVQNLRRIADGLHRPDKDLVLTASLSGETNCQCECKTNYNRELLYNLEHTVHHMAFIRMGIEAITNIHLPVGFGVAESTMQSRKTCVQ
jgi:hypothetical protein